MYFEVYHGMYSEGPSVIIYSAQKIKIHPFLDGIEFYMYMHVALMLHTAVCAFSLGSIVTHAAISSSSNATITSDI